MSLFSSGLKRDILLVEMAADRLPSDAIVIIVYRWQAAASQHTSRECSDDISFGSKAQYTAAILLHLRLFFHFPKGSAVLIDCIKDEVPVLAAGDITGD